MCSSLAAGLFAQGASEFEQGGIPLSDSAAGVDLAIRHDAHWLEKSAERALELGKHEIAFELATRSLELRASEPDYKRAELIAIDALLAQERWTQAVARLDALAERANAPQSAVRLRRAMIAFAEEDADAVSRILDDAQVARLVEGDIAWFWFLRGWTFLQAGEGEESREAFQRAQDEAIQQSPALQGHIGYLIFRAQLKARTASADTIAQLQSAVVEMRGREIGYAYAQQLAVAYYDLGRVSDAVRLIDQQLSVLPSELSQMRAQFQLLQSMAAGLERPEGRQAFQDLMGANRFPGLMSIGLQQAFSKARLEDTGQPLLESVLNQIIDGSENHDLLDQALYYRSVFKFQKEDYVGAEEDASTLQERFPSSPYRRGMLALQASSAWNRQRYRTAASYLQQMRSEFPDLVESASLSALIADCYLRAGLQSNTLEDFRNAAEAYATAMNSVSEPAQGGPILYQLILARLRSGQIEQAVQALDDPKWRFLASGEMIWRSEWMLVSEMRRVGLVTEGYDRAQAAMALAVTDPTLRLRLLWLAVKLSLESGQQEDTSYWVDQVDQFIEETGVSELGEELVGRVKASSMLALAEAHTVLDEPERAVELWETLRRDYAGYEAALLSYIAQARYYSSLDRTVEAQQLLVSLADNFPENRLAPMALYEAAVNAERRGQDAFLDQANKLLQRIASSYPDSEMVYYARLKQADLLRKLNKFGSAERIYEFLENEYSDRPDRFLAQMSLADTLLAQANEDPAKFEAAISRLELLMDLPEAPLGLRVEAGYKLGQAWRSRGEELKAKQAYWLLYDLAIVEEPRIRFLTRKGRYWLARSLFALAEMSKEEGELDAASEFYEQIVTQRLWGGELAKARLEVLRPALETSN